MAQDPGPQTGRPSDPGLAPGMEPARSGRASEIVAGLLSVIWVVSVLAYILTSPPGDDVKTLGLVMTLLIVFLPLALIWVAVITLRSVRELRAEAARLQAAVDAMRASYVQTSSQMQAAALKPSVEKKLDEIAAAAKQAETVLATFSSRRDTALSVPSADRKAALAVPKTDPEAEEPRLALGTPAEEMRPPLSVADFIRALNFPETPEDKEGFRALRLALEDRSVAKLIRAAQDVLTLLSQEGIYMDDLKPEMARPDVWRRFAAGERGRTIAALGGIRDRSSLALTAARMREDTIFRDAAHHFLRTFDRTFAIFEKNASDAELADLADTRTARAFMLFGRVAGVFD
ncbi:hypothetical protein G5B31_01250 [Rhodobacter sp. SGA-6-6]|uniref:hypothetical protein n=1 Tax=Rhodobacter sp. SGA-6-6 TaxID=2710882 RepID=UPI0013E9C20A|nr:hypothetical protein [Rhodobacter sp. SGA-6-6]NGM44156.1 hypothetical protein [Rhodobacter sp. SGA-6-6]